jgi:hypothetical protein
MAFNSLNYNKSIQRKTGFLLLCGSNSFAERTADAGKTGIWDRRIVNYCLAARLELLDFF